MSAATIFDEPPLPRVTQQPSSTTYSTAPIAITTLPLAGEELCAIRAAGYLDKEIELPL
jgi:hypothetical protein